MEEQRTLILAVADYWGQVNPFSDVSVTAPITDVLQDVGWENGVPISAFSHARGEENLRKIDGVAARSAAIGSRSGCDVTRNVTRNVDPQTNCQKR